MGRSPCCDKVGLKKGSWTPEEDQKLLAYIDQNGHGSWRLLPAKAGLRRCGKSCRLRWSNYLRPDIKRGKFSLQEEQTIIQLHALLGNRWSTIANHLPKRTDNEIKNYWNTHLKKRLTKMGIDPVTHRQKNNTLGSGQSKDTANLSHMAQWESARVEAEARLVRESKLVSTPYHGLSASAQLLSKATVHPPLKEPMLPPPLHPPINVSMSPPCLDVLKAWQGVWKKPNGFFTSNIGSLESLTSTILFSHDMFKVPNAGFCENSAIPPLINHVENSKTHEVAENVQNSFECSEKTNEELEVPNKMENTTMVHEMAYPIDAATFMDSFDELLPDNTDIFNITGLYDNLDGSCSGSLDDNKKYWNLLNPLGIKSDSW